MTKIYSYVVRYDSGFAPNPFYGYCTLATCKPDIRRSACIGDWVVGSASNDRSVRRGGHIVYAMRVTDTLTFDEYAADKRFLRKQPLRRGSRKQSCGDNIYFHDPNGGPWHQLDSFHSQENGALHVGHLTRDTGVNRVLVSDDFVYFGGEGPLFPDIQDSKGKRICKSGIGRSCFDEPLVIHDFVAWIRGLGVCGFQGMPQEWISLRG